MKKILNANYANRTLMVANDYSRKSALDSRLFALVFCFLLTGCTLHRGGGNEGQLQSFPFHTVEPSWIRNGEPIEFEGEMWYPQDGTETLLDSEVMYLGEYRGVQFFLDKVDVRPYDRLYTKFGKNKFRYFEKHTSHDQTDRPSQVIRQ